VESAIMLLRQFSWKSVGEKMLKIGQYSQKLWPKSKVAVFIGTLYFSRYCHSFILRDGDWLWPWTVLR